MNIPEHKTQKTAVGVETTAEAAPQRFWTQSSLGHWVVKNFTLWDAPQAAIRLDGKAAIWAC